MVTIPGGRRFLSNLPAGRAVRRRAGLVVAISIVAFIAMAPFAQRPLAPVAAFIPLYQAALVMNDLITAVLLYGQYAILRSRALLVLAGAYLFTALICAVHTLSFPGLLAPGGLLGAGPQTTAWLYMFWHAGFPLAVIAYALLKAEPGRSRESSAAAPIVACVALVIAAVAALAALTTTGAAALPAIMQGNRYTPAMLGVVASVCAAAPLALAVLWRRRPHSVLDVWLMVVMCAWFFDVALSAVLNAGRFDLGFYAGRIYGFIAGSVVLFVLLLENAALYARLVETRESERRQARELAARHAERLRILHGIDRGILAEESPKAIAGAVIAPLRELLGVPRAIVNLFDLERSQVQWLAAAGRRRVTLDSGVRYSLELMGDVEALRRGENQVIETRALPPGPEAEALLASGVEVYMVVPMNAGGELIGALSFGGTERVFPPEQAAIAGEVATQLAIALKQARLLEDVKRHADELELRVEERTAELQLANRDLEAFSFSVSHDLRAPLRAIDGYSEMLVEGYAQKLDEEGLRLLGVVRRSVERMGSMIEALLAFSRFGRAAINRQTVQLDALVAEVREELIPAGEGRRIEWTVGTLGSVQADPALLRHVIVNLLGNAVKYTRKCEVARIEVGRNGEDVFYVKDNGAGFDMKNAGRLFGVFQRLHHQSDFEGTGVGLAIVARVIERHGGQIWAEAAAGDGAAFYFTFGEHGERALSEPRTRAAA